jgi:selenoprotein W-related protein
MVEQILGEFEHQTESLKLIPSGGGVFEVVVNGDLIYSKKETGRHAEYEEVAVEIRKRLS